MWVPFNNNPCGRSVGDCSVRAVSAALGLTWYQAFDLLYEEGRRSCDMQSADATWGAVLRSNGFRRYAIPNTFPDGYTVSDFATDHPRGIYVLAIGGHVVTVINGDWLDSWDSGRETPQYYFRRA